MATSFERLYKGNLRTQTATICCLQKLQPLKRLSGQNTWQPWQYLQHLRRIHAANLENRVLSRPISLKGQLQKNLQEQEINLELFLLRKTFTDSMKNDLLRLNKHESSISEKNFEDRSPDLKSARKTEIKTVYILTLWFFSILGIGKHHCVPRRSPNIPLCFRVNIQKGKKIYINKIWSKC